ncbi:COP9 signalosome complex subunit 7 [Exophiala dermatitidis]
MDQSQARALAALQPFVHLATTTKSPSPRFVAELIKGAISAPGAYVFTELLQTPAVQSLRGTELQSWLTLLEIFSWGTYEEYKNIPDLPQLDDAQTLKLRQLSLLTLASPFAPNLNGTEATTTTNTLTYPSLLKSLSLPDAASLESLVTQSIYSGLLTGRLSPTSNPPVVNIVSVAPLRDLRPQSLPALLQILQTWESRCTSVVSELEAHISAIRDTAAQRSATQKKWQDVVDAAVLSTSDSSNKPSSGDGGESNTGNKNNGGAGRAIRGAAAAAHRLPSKRDLDQQMEGEAADVSDDEGQMDWDEGGGGGGDVGIPASGSSSRGGHGAGGGSRGAKRNRGRGSK